MSFEKIANWAAVLIISLLLFALSPLWNSMFVEKRSIEYWIQGKTRINDEMFGVSAKDWPDVKASYQGKQIEDATFIRLVFSNTGGVSIKAEDFEGPITFVSSVPDQILKYRIIRSYPPALSPKFEITKEGLELSPLLLNPTDGFIVELFSAKDFEIKQVNGRIVGIKSISQYSRDRYSGLSIQRVDELEYGRSNQERVLLLPPYIIAILIFVTLVMSIIGLRLNRIATRPEAKILAFSLCFILYIVGAFCANLFPRAIVNRDMPVWLNYLLVFLVTAVPIVIGIRVRRLFSPPSHTSEALTNKSAETLHET